MAQKHPPKLGSLDINKRALDGKWQLWFLGFPPHSSKHHPPEWLLIFVHFERQALDRWIKEVLPEYREWLSIPVEHRNG